MVTRLLCAVILYRVIPNSCETPLSNGCRNTVTVGSAQTSLSAARLTWRYKSRPDLSSKATLFERIPQNSSYLAVQNVQAAAKLQLFVRYDALNCDFNNDRQHVTDERCG